MLLLVFSDSHGFTATMEETVLKYRDTVNYIIHAGDLLHDAKKLESFVKENSIKCEVIAVPGNCDVYHADEPQEKEFELGGRKIFLLHGHTRNIGISSTVLKLTAEKKGSELVIFGHSHISEEFYHNGITFFNPGSVFKARGGKRTSYGIIKIEEGKIFTEIVLI